MVWRRDYTASTAVFTAYTEVFTAYKVVFTAYTEVFTAYTVVFTASTHSRNHSHSGGEITQSLATELKTEY